MTDKTLKRQVEMIHTEVEAFRECLERGEELAIDDILRTFQNICYALFTVDKRLTALEKINKLRSVEE